MRLLTLMPFVIGTLLADNTSNTTSPTPIVSTFLPTTTPNTPLPPISTTPAPTTTDLPQTTTPPTTPAPTTTLATSTIPPTSLPPTTELPVTTTLQPQTTPPPTTTASTPTPITPFPVETPIPSEDLHEQLDSNIPATDRPGRTLTPIPTSQSNSSNDDGNSSSTPVIIGVSIAAVLFLGLTAFFVYRRRQYQQDNVDSMVMAHRNFNNDNSYALPPPSQMALNQGNKVMLFEPKPKQPPLALTVEHDSVLQTGHVVAQEKRKRSPSPAETIAVLGNEQDRSSSFFTWDSQRGMNQNHSIGNMNRSNSDTLSEASSFASQKSMSYNDHVAALDTDDDNHKFSFLSYGSGVSSDMFTPAKSAPHLCSFDGTDESHSMPSSADIFMSQRSGTTDIYRSGSKEELQTMNHLSLYSFDEASYSDRDSYDSATQQRTTTYSTGSEDSGFNL